MKAGAVAAISLLKNTLRNFDALQAGYQAMVLIFSSSDQGPITMTWIGHIEYSKNSTLITHIKIRASLAGQFTITHRISVVAKLTTGFSEKETRWPSIKGIGTN